jgi:Zn-dependent peptidase ImmA (M78 family)
MDENELTKFFSIIGNNFELGNWEVDLKFIDADEMNQITGNATDFAVTCYKDNVEKACVFMNTEAKYCDWDKPEFTLIHELIHVMFHTVDEHIRDNIKKQKLYTILEERFLNNMSYTMYNLLEETKDGYT